MFSFKKIFATKFIYSNKIEIYSGWNYVSPIRSSFQYIKFEICER